MAGRLEGKVAIITGAGSGQGAEAAVIFAAEGAKVALFDRNAESVTKKADEIGPSAKALVCDISDARSVEQSVAEVIREFGKVDVLYNNAGVILRRPTGWDITQDGPTGDISEEVFDTVIAINLKGPFLMSKYVLPHMVARQTGSIINISALAGAHHGTSNHAYCTAKAGVVGLTRALAKSYGPHGIRANALCPGLVETPLVSHVLADAELVARYTDGSPIGRLGRPEEIARVALFLASDESSFVTGSVVTADGGFMIS